MYHDPKGTRSLEQTNYTETSTKNTSINSTDDNYYKKRIETLNEEIKALNDENKSLNNKLAMVYNYALNDSLLCVTTYFPVV